MAGELETEVKEHICYQCGKPCHAVVCGEVPDAFMGTDCCSYPLDYWEVPEEED